MSTPLVPDDLWTSSAPFLPPAPPKPQGGRPRVPDRACLTGILFVLQSGIPWEMLPQELGCGSGMTCWRRLRDWQAAGVWDRVHQVLLDHLGQANQLDWRRASIDSSRIPAKKGAPRLARIRRIAANRARSATLWWTAMVDRRGLPLSRWLTGANRHDSAVFEAVLAAVPPIKQPSGQRRTRPAKGHADKAYDIPRCRQALRQRHSKVRIARKGVEGSDRLGRHRWVVERTLAWLTQFRRVTIRYERRADIHDAVLSLGCALICFRSVQQFC